MKRKQPSGSKRLLYKSDASYSGACGLRAFSRSFCLGWGVYPIPGSFMATIDQVDHTNLFSYLQDL
jgi:hypothetical protein